MLTRDELNRFDRWLKLNAEALETAERRELQALLVTAAMCSASRLLA
jgi:hypothetical protein